MRESALTWLLCCIGWVLAPAASALSLAPITLHSHLDQPLDARVALSGVSSADLANLHVIIHAGEGANAYQEFVPLQHAVKEDSSGHYISITSSGVIREPILTFTLEVDWPHGRYAREYSLLIDPQ